MSSLNHREDRARPDYQKRKRKRRIKFHGEEKEVIFLYTPEGRRIPIHSNTFKVVTTPSSETNTWQSVDGLGVSTPQPPDNPPAQDVSSSRPMAA